MVNQIDCRNTQSHRTRRTRKIETTESMHACVVLLVCILFWNLYISVVMHALDKLFQQLAKEEEIKRLRKEFASCAKPIPFFDFPFIPKRYGFLCWCICNFGMYSFVYFMYYTPMFILRSIYNVIESCHALMFLSGDSIM